MKKKELFKNIIGYDDEKKIIERVIDILNNKEKYQKLGVGIPHGLLLYGPPGTGKTTFSKEILKNINRKTYIIRKTISDGDFMKRVCSIFEEAKKNIPSAILLDDLDKYSERDKFSQNDEEYVAIQSLLDDVKDMDIFILATANNTCDFPGSLLRSGRFDIKINLGNPNEKDSMKIIDYYLKKKKIDKDVNVKNLSHILVGSSCATLEKICNQAGIYAGFINKNKISMIELIRASLEERYNWFIEDLYKNDKYDINTAYHEAGHALVSEVLEPGSVSFVTAVNSKGETQGITIYHENDYYWQDIKYMETRAKACLAGKASSEIVFNKCDVGANSDLHRAFDLIERFIDNYCINDFTSWIRDARETSNYVKENKDKEIQKLITEYYNDVKILLTENRNLLDILAHELCKRKILFHDDIQDILNNPKKYSLVN